jgi:hypothetical protein
LIIILRIETKKTRKQKRVNNLKIRIKKQENEELFKLFITYYKFKISNLMSHMIIQVCDMITQSFQILNLISNLTLFFKF